MSCTIEIGKQCLRRFVDTEVLDATEVQRVNFFLPLLIAQSLHRLYMDVSGMEEGKAEKLWEKLHSIP